MSAATQIAYIGITIPDGQWGSDTTLVAGNLEEYCRRTWPEAKLDIGISNDTRQRIVVFNGNDDDTGPAVHNCHLSIENMLAQYVWEQGFDAAAR
jgi:adenosine/AMP kinase